MKRYISILAVIAAMTAPAFSQSGNEEEQIIYKDDVNSIKLNKYVAESTNGEYMITLSSFVTGTRETYETRSRKPVDMVLVLDGSGSMGSPFIDNELFLHPSKLKYSSCYIKNCYMFNTYRDTWYAWPSNPYVSTLYYKHSSDDSLNGNYYPLHQLYFPWGSPLTTRYCIYYETGEKVYNPITHLQENKRYFLGGNSTDGYKAQYISDIGLPAYLREGEDPSTYNSYTAKAGYFTLNEDDLLYDGPLYSSSRAAALWSAVSAFADVVQEDDEEFLSDETGHHRVGMVSFSGPYSSEIGCGSYIGSNHYRYSYSQIVYPIAPIGSMMDHLNGLSDLYMSGPTQTDYGMRCAKEALEQAADDGKERKKVIILFTDGEPSESQNFSASVANSAISYAKALKDNGVEIYVVGLTSQASSEALSFMEYVSSDYPLATSMTNGGAKAFDKYLSLANTGSQLATIFESIASSSAKTEIGYSLTETNQVVFDALTKHFLLPEDVTSTDAHRIGVYTRDFLGIVDGVYNFDPRLKPLLGARVSLGGDNNREIIVSGFDFAENWCGLWRRFDILGVMHDSWQGKELVIKIPIVIDPANPGGANVNTNEATSGIYNDDGTGHPDFEHPIKPFPIPEVSLPNIVVVKNGMKANNSAIFVVTRLNADGTEDSTYEPFTVMAIADGTGTAKIRLKLVGEGRYKVSEQSWSWAYDSTPTATYAKDDGHTSVQGNTITRNVLGATADSTENGTLYIFTNTDRKNIPAHDEDAVNNVFFTPQVVIH